LLARRVKRAKSVVGSQLLEAEDPLIKVDGPVEFLDIQRRFEHMPYARHPRVDGSASNCLFIPSEILARKMHLRPRSEMPWILTCLLYW
jgi:hypothetical protein